VTEAIRGEGARLLDDEGERFVEELAPRDEVALAIQRRMRETGARCVWLDMRDVDPDRFPNVVQALRASGLDPARELVPVSPAAHYVMGGVVADLDGGTTVPGLYAVGETACTGLHGANRLASNSLSECFVFGGGAARAGLAEPFLRWGEPPDTAAIAVPLQQTREALWRDAGIERAREGLERLLEDPHPVARLVAACALLRCESRGAHLRTDFPATDSALDGFHAVVHGDQPPVFERWL